MVQAMDFLGGDQVSERVSALWPEVVRWGFFALIAHAQGMAGCGGPGGRGDYTG